MPYCAVGVAALNGFSDISSLNGTYRSELLWNWISDFHSNLAFEIQRVATGRRIRKK
jgi:hypothetical protein